MDVFVCVTSLNRIENLQKRTLRLLLYGYEYKYEQLLNKAGRGSMTINRLRTFMCRNLQDVKGTESNFYEKYFYRKRNR